ncbi:MAG: hypothetical protein BalsKO_23850 [Balneolaceae bacterium]
MKRALLFYSLIISTLLIGCNSTNSNSGGFDEAIGRTAPDFTYTSLSGEQFTLSDFQGKVVYLFFYGAGCPHCRSNGPVTESQINSTFEGNSSFMALGLDTWNSSASANNSFRSATNISYPLLLNAGQSLVDYYGNSSSYDRSVVIDASGKIAYQGSGFVNTDVENVVRTIETELEKINTKN